MNLSLGGAAVFTFVTQLLGSVSNQRRRYLALAAFAALVVFAAFLGQEMEHG